MVGGSSHHLKKTFSSLVQSVCVLSSVLYPDRHEQLKEAGMLLQREFNPQIVASLAHSSMSENRTLFNLEMQKC